MDTVYIIVHGRHLFDLELNILTIYLTEVLMWKMFILSSFFDPVVHNYVRIRKHSKYFKWQP